MRDFGPGIPVEELPYVKQKFYKGSSKARGSGIGLAVCDEIMRLHNGTFDIANASGGGADGLDFYRVIADKWRDALLPNGLMAFEVGIGQADEVLRIMRANGFGDIQIVKDLHGIPRVVYGRLCKEI